MYDLVCLRKKIQDRFSPSDLRILCFDLGIDYDDLPGSAKAVKVVELILYFRKHDELESLMAYCQEERPRIHWDDCLKSSPPASPPKETRQTENKPGKRPLTQVNGIGPVFAERLYQNDINTLKQLVALDETQLDQIIQADGRAERILAEANLILNPSKPQGQKLLQKVKGVGPKYADLLYLAGVETLEELAALNEAALKRILGLRSNKRIKEFILEATMMIIACNRKEERFLLQQVSGIGPAYAQRLCRAGINTITELLWFDAEKLAEILRIGDGRAAAILAEAKKLATNP
jgi:predicted flap endonuclease-1-like 5' DNA nuclease